MDLRQQKRLQAPGRGHHPRATTSDPNTSAAPTKIQAAIASPYTAHPNAAAMTGWINSPSLLTSGLRWPTAAGIHALNHGMFTLASGYRDRGMAAYSELQQA